MNIFVFLSYDLSFSHRLMNSHRLLRIVIVYLYAATYIIVKVYLTMTYIQLFVGGAVERTQQVSNLESQGFSK